MNQNTIETIRFRLASVRRHSKVECDVCAMHVEKAYHELQDLANRLEAAPQQSIEQGELTAFGVRVDDEGSFKQSKEQPPVEQSVWNVGQIEQDECGHPSPVGLVEIYDSKKFCHTCRAVDCSHIREVVEMGKTQGWFITFEVGKVKPVAPPAVIEPEPELDEFELELREWQANDDKDVAILERVIGLYREIISRKGDKIENG